jgi:integrase
MGNDDLQTFADEVYSLGRDIRKSTAAFYRWKINVFAAYLGRRPTLADLNDITLNKYLAHRLETAERDTARGDRAALVALWQHAYDHRYVDTQPGRVRPIKRQPKVVTGWTEAELGRLLEVIDGKTGRFRHVNVARSAFWRAVTMTLYDTGVRLGDLERLTLEQVRRSTFVVVQSKTQKPVDCPLSFATLEAIKKITSPKRQKPFSDVLKRRSFVQEFASLCKAAGLTGRTKRLRITSGSLVESLHPGEGHLHLGNGRQVFESFYHWHAITKRPTRLPPSLSG